MSAPDVAQAYSPFVAEVAQLRPAGCEIVDVHTHLGLDDDGRSQSLPGLLAELDRAGIARACVFPLHDPARRPAYRVPNDRVLGWAVYAARLAGHPSVLYDSSWFAATDLLALLARVPAERLVFGSDPPYGRPLTTLYVALRVAARAGFDAATTRAMLGDTVGRVLRGEPLPAATAPRVAPTLTLHASLMRVVLYGTMLLAALFAKNVVTAQRALELARSVCRDPASAAAAAALDRIGAALRAAAELLQRRETEAALDLAVLSVALAATEPA